MNIAIIIATLPEPNRKLGGVEVSAHRLANALSQFQDCSVTVLSPSYKPTDAKYKYRQLFPWMNERQSNLVFRWILFPVLLNFVDLKEFDIIHFHGDDWFFFRRSIPSIRTMHGSALNEARTAGSLKRVISQRFVAYPLEKLSVCLASQSLAIGQETSKIYCIDQFINNGVDTSVFCPGDKTEYPSIIFIGHWKGRKRGKFIYECFVEKIAPKFPRAKLFMVSDFSQNHPQVIHVSYPNDEELASLLRKSLVFAYPSQYEGFGMAYIEALASGTSILTSQNEGAHHVLCGGEYGCISSDEDFSDNLIALLSSAERRRSMEQKGLGRAAEFAWNKVAKKHLEFYEGVIEKAAS